MNTISSRFVSAGVLVIWGVVLGYFCISGRIASYLHPAFHVFTAISAAILVLLAIGLLLTRPSGNPDCAEEKPSPLAHGASLFVLVVPLLAATVISPSEFGVTTVTNRGLIENIADLPAFTMPVEPPLPREDGSIGESTPIDTASYISRNESGQIKAQTVDLLYAAAEPTMRQDFENKEVEIIGQFLPARIGNASGDRFNLIRLFVMCCAADARPVSVTVQSRDAKSFPDMTWLKVTGKATFPIESGRHTALIIADSITEVEPPPETFIY
jgi:uncharacterized repeat protein (TIGR03943 family)